MCAPCVDAQYVALELTQRHPISDFENSPLLAKGGEAGAAAIRGAQAVVLANQNGAVLTLAGEQTDLIVSLDLSGLALSLK